MIRKADLLRPQIFPLHPLEAVFFHIGTSHCNNIYSELVRVQYLSIQRSEKGGRQVYSKNSQLAMHYALVLYYPFIIVKTC